MTLVDIIFQEPASERGKLFLVAGLAGLSNALVLRLINQAAQTPHEVETHVFLLFGLTILAHVLCVRWTNRRCTELVETSAYRTRLRLVGKLQLLELQGLERMGMPELYEQLTQSVASISNASVVLTALVRAPSMLLFAVLYIAWLSVPAALLLVGTIGLGVFIQQFQAVHLRAEFIRLSQAQREFFELFTDFLRGFKEVRLNTRRRQELGEDILQNARRLKDVSSVSSQLLDDTLLFSTCLLYFMAGTLAFVLPQHVTLTPTRLTQLVAGALFIWGPIAGVIRSLPSYLRSNQALAAIQSLEEKLDANLPPQVDSEWVSDPWQGRLKRIEISQLGYTYTPMPGTAGFHLGPVDLQLQAGEIVFIVGGNGSGKSTLLKVLTGLYPAVSGSIHVDGVRVEPRTISAYRELICAIFSDFHLFTRLYGLRDVQPEAVQALIEEMHLGGQTSFEGERFTRQALSTGQRKRLATIVALLEDRPLYVFDEWAADQDAEFRQYFYMELLPLLRSRGKTVLAVSHDDRYFGCADRVVTMEYGQVRSVERYPAAPKPP